MKSSSSWIDSSLRMRYWESLRISTVVHDLNEKGSSCARSGRQDEKLRRLYHSTMARGDLSQPLPTAYCRRGATKSRGDACARVYFSPVYESLATLMNHRPGCFSARSRPLLKASASLPMVDGITERYAFITSRCSHREQRYRRYLSFNRGCC